ncbi:probable WRKY transcription factor 3 isoform X2 [Cryptomeria japonica]|uniref:probable WRKY transcription factor 3 isoform X2 n=1 Tax=Cryptomeria japonica TaxID=3369 RepID=UPI0027DA5A22|nr:probable WRKY transcription factor 3 isoform X2 [Cryptomeria japonica]
MGDQQQQQEEQNQRSNNNYNNHNNNSMISPSSYYMDYQLASPVSAFLNEDLDMNSTSSFSELLGGGSYEGFSVEKEADSHNENGGSFAERRLRFKSTPPSSLPIMPRSPYFSIPPGLSPTTLLDSPVLLSSSQALLSPTTGTFPLLPFTFENSSSTAQNVLKDEEQDSSSFAFKPLTDSNSSSQMQSFGNLVTFSYGQPQALKGSQDDAQMWSLPDFKKTRGPVTNEFSERQVPGNTRSQDASLDAAPLQSVSLEQQQERQTSNQLSEVNQNTLVPQHVIERRSDDGYNWRKYGQKHVKGSEYPRSYYKCTHPSCPTKKKVERSLDGQVTEIVYKGVHNHPKPQPSRRTGAARVAHEEGETTVGSAATIKVEDPSSTPPGQTSSHLESADTPEHSSISASEDDDARTQADKLLGDDAEEDEHDSKRRRKEQSASDIIGATRTIREPRVVVQTTSDIDILDDGYRWRKYGQKVVKGNPNPRSYYKCTNGGCPVRKHVERASHDAKAVITTYEGKHNHDVPAPRNSSHSNAGLGNGPSVAILQNNVASSTNSMPLTGSQPQGTVSHFDRHPDLSNDYPQSNYMFGRLANESLNSQDRGVSNQGMGMGGSLGAFGLDSRHVERQQTSGVSTSFSMQINPANQGYSATNFNTSMQPYLNQNNERDIGLVRPKEEQKDNFYYDGPLH